MAQGDDLPTLARTGIDGLDDILNGGLTPDRMYLVEGTPGTGKTTLGLGFLLTGVKVGEIGLYITLAETEVELRLGRASGGADIAPALRLLRDLLCSPSFGVR